MRPSDFLSNVNRFWARVSKDADTGCWLWTGEQNRMGYGRYDFWHDNKRSRILSHRLALILTGEALDPDAVVMHSCDTPLCVNPAHLTAGTQLDNIHDAMAKGRMNMDGLAIGWEMSRKRGAA